MSDEPGATALPQDVDACVRALATSAGDVLVGIVFFGSRLLDTSPDRHSAADLFVIADDYGAFYRRLRDHGLVRGRPGALAAWNRWLPPNVLSIDAGSGPACKCFVIDTASFAREMSARARDHFCRGRLSQHVAIVHARDDAVRAQLEGLVDRARQASLAWVPDRLDRTFGVDDYCLAMLRRSFAGEIRPEAAARVFEVFEAQRDAMTAAFDSLLRTSGPTYGIVADGGGFRRGPRRAWWRRLGTRLWFARSRVRATLRWVKYVQTYEGWLDYVVHKVHRRTGLHVELTDAQRRWPFVLLWPKFFAVMWALRRDRASHAPGGRRNG